MRSDFLGVYSPPGIYTNPVKGPQLAVNSSLPSAVGIVGTTVGYRSFTESFQFRDTNEANPQTYPLTQKGIIENTIVIRKRETLVAYLGPSNNGNTTNFTVEDIGGAPGSSNARYGIRRNPDTSTIPADDVVQVTYNYTDDQYYQPITFYDYRDVVTTYGDPLRWNDSTKTVEIISEISLAAKFAFLNGAYKVVCVAVDPTGETAVSGDYNNAISKLKDDSSIAVVVPCNGISSAAFIKGHVTQQSASRFERRAILGFDGKAAIVPSETRVGAAKSTGSGLDSRILMVSPSQFTCYAPEVDKDITLGGQYMAASLAGMVVAMPFAQPLTHKYPVGWTGTTREDSLLDGEMTTETMSGLCVIEHDRRNNIRVRHGVTTDPSDLLSREWSITGQQDALVYRLRDYLDDANLIGQPIYNYTLVNVKASAEAALQSLVRDGLLVDYVGLAVRQLLTNPDVIEISFGWRPAFPLNYIVLTFAVNLTTGSLNANNVTGNRNNFTSTTQTTVTAPMGSVTNNFGGSGNTLQSF
jgi:hypothetical protein